ncbi:MAG: paraquat-inducible protein A [Rhodobacter sp.]|nr:paraquat-inducible protein A [Rhodobacter sp.]
MLAATSAVLMIAAVFFPFLDLTAGGKTTHSSLYDAVMAFSTGFCCCRCPLPPQR